MFPLLLLLFFAINSSFAKFKQTTVIITKNLETLNIQLGTMCFTRISIVLTSRIGSRFLQPAVGAFNSIFDKRKITTNNFRFSSRRLGKSLWITFDGLILSNVLWKIIYRPTGKTSVIGLNYDNYSYTWIKPQYGSIFSVSLMPIAMIR